MLTFIFKQPTYQHSKMKSMIIIVSWMTVRTVRQSTALFSFSIIFKLATNMGRVEVIRVRLPFLLSESILQFLPALWTHARHFSLC